MDVWFINRGGGNGLDEWDLLGLIDILICFLIEKFLYMTGKKWAVRDPC